jgi:hypothetical protein
VFQSFINILGFFNLFADVIVNQATRARTANQTMCHVRRHPVNMAERVDRWRTFPTSVNVPQVSKFEITKITIVFKGSQKNCIDHRTFGLPDEKTRMMGNISELK